MCLFVLPKEPQLVSMFVLPKEPQLVSMYVLCDCINVLGKLPKNVLYQFVHEGGVAHALACATDI